MICDCTPLLHCLIWVLLLNKTGISCKWLQLNKNSKIISCQSEQFKLAVRNIGVLFDCNLALIQMSAASFITRINKFEHIIPVLAGIYCFPVGGRIKFWALFNYLQGTTQWDYWLSPGFIFLVQHYLHLETLKQGPSITFRISVWDNISRTLEYTLTEEIRCTAEAACKFKADCFFPTFPLVSNSVCYSGHGFYRCWLWHWPVLFFPMYFHYLMMIFAVKHFVT